jgi:hypothetical protein
MPQLHAVVKQKAKEKHNYIWRVFSGLRGPSEARHAATRTRWRHFGHFPQVQDGFRPPERVRRRRLLRRAHSRRRASSGILVRSIHPHHITLHAVVSTVFLAWFFRANNRFSQNAPKTFPLDYDLTRIPDWAIRKENWAAPSPGKIGSSGAHARIDLSDSDSGAAMGTW